MKSFMAPLFLFTSFSSALSLTISRPFSPIQATHFGAGCGGGRGRCGWSSAAGAALAAPSTGRVSSSFLCEESSFPCDDI